MNMIFYFSLSAGLRFKKEKLHNLSKKLQIFFSNLATSLVFCKNFAQTGLSNSIHNLTEEFALANFDSDIVIYIYV